MTGTRKEGWSVQTGQRGSDSKGHPLRQGPSQNPTAVSNQELGSFSGHGSIRGGGALMGAVGVAEAASPALGPFMAPLISSSKKTVPPQRC